MDMTKLVEQAFLKVLVGVSGITFRAYHVSDEGGDEETIEYPVCEIVASPEQEVQPNAPLITVDVAIAVATYYDDDKLRQTLTAKADEIFDLITDTALDTAMGTISGGSDLGVQGLTYTDNATTQEQNDQRQARIYTVYLYDAS